MRTNSKRSFSLALFVLGLLLVAAAPVAQAQFMEYPFYGYPIINCYFDHQYPNYTKNGNLLRYDCQYGSWYYDGHAGVDYGEQYTPILNVASGTLEVSGWYSSNHESGLGLYMRVNHGNNYRTLYGHLSAILYHPTVWVGQNYHIGTGGTTGNSTGPHLHFEVQRYVSGYWRAVDPYGWCGSFTDPWYSSTGAASTYLWVANPETPWPSSYGETVVDNGDSGFTKGCAAGGSCPYWYYVSGWGLNGSMYRTYSNGSVADYWARWTPNLPAWDYYEVQVHIPNNYATTHAARYTINYYFGSRVVNVDQHDTYGSGAGRWVSLGTYYFRSGSYGYVEITDATYIPGNYTEPYSTYRHVGVDAVKFIRR